MRRHGVALLFAAGLVAGSPARADDKCERIFADYEISLDWIEAQLRRNMLASEDAIETRFDRLENIEARFGFLCFPYYDRGRELVARRKELQLGLDELAGRADAAGAVATEIDEDEPWPPPDDHDTQENEVKTTGPGTLVVTSYPIGAEVLVDGVARGRTQLEVRLVLEPGEHRLELWHGSLRAVQKVTVEAGSREELRVNLLEQGKLAARTRPVEPATTPAASEPRTAAEARAPVWKETTAPPPLEQAEESREDEPDEAEPEDEAEDEAALERAWEQLHAVQQKAEAREAAHLTVAALQPVATAPELAAAPQPAAPKSTVLEEPTGTVVVTSKPAGASVFLDGALCGKTPLTIAAVGSGAHRVRLVVGPYRLIYVVGVRSGNTARLDVPLREAIVEQVVDAERF